jgi:hypothetical protein
MRTLFDALATALGAFFTAMFLLVWLAVWPAWRLLPYARTRSV